jgi:hypothetical protein
MRHLEIFKLLLLLLLVVLGISPVLGKHSTIELQLQKRILFLLRQGLAIKLRLHFWQYLNCGWYIDHIASQQ